MHSTRVLRAGEEYNSINPIEDDADHNHVETIENNKATIDEEKVITETVKEDADIRVKRKSSIRRPNKNRKIKFKKINDERWMSGEVKSVGDNIGTNQFKCSILLENDDLKEVDFSDRDFTWEYEQEQCETCHKGFDNRKGLKRHQLLIHQDNDNYECEQCSIKVNNLDALKKHKQTVHVENTQQNKTPKCVNFDLEEINYNEQDCDVCHLTFETTAELTDHTQQNHEETADQIKIIRQKKIRFKEVNQDRKKNEKWIEHNNFIHEEEIKYAEIKENDDNFEKCQEAKKKELQNFDDYNVYDEVEDVGQPVMGTRYVLTEKDNGDIKARFVVKGFQENNENQSDSPTASRETLKVFFTIAANEAWTIEGSDVRSAFLQSEKIDREVFVHPPPERKKMGKVWKLNKPAYGLDDASRKWFQSTERTLLSLGMTQSLNDNCLFFLHKVDILHGILLIHVDDFLTGGSDIFKTEVISKLREKYCF